MLLTTLYFPLALSFEIALSQKDVLHFTKPKGYIYRIASNSSDPNNQKKSALQFSHFNSLGYKNFVFRIFIYNDPNLEYANHEVARSYLRKKCNRYKENSIEGRVVIKANKAGRGRVILSCAFTDRSVSKKAKPGQFRNVSLSMVRERGYVFLAVAYSNGLSGKLHKRYVQTMKSIRLRSQ